MRLLLALLIALPAAAQPAITVAIDAGHGGHKLGAVGRGGAAEKDLALILARLIAEKVESDLGGRAVLLREADTDLPLHARTELANALGADVFISIHLNSMPTERTRRTTHGVETYFLSADASDADARAVAERENADAPAPAARPQGALAAILDDLARLEAHHDSALLAAALHKRLVDHTGAQDRGVMQAPFTVLMGAKMPAVLCEVGFLSHPEEGRALGKKSRQDAIAKAVVKGIGDYMKKVARKTAER